MKTIMKAFGMACERAGMEDVTPHTLKHTFITWGLRSGATVWDMAGLTATSVETISRVYGHHVQDDLQRTVNEIANGYAQKGAQPRKRLDEASI